MKLGVKVTNINIVEIKKKKNKKNKKDELIYNEILTKKVEKTVNIILYNYYKLLNIKLYKLSKSFRLFVTEKSFLHMLSKQIHYFM